VKAVGRFMSVMERLRERAESGAGVGDLIQELLEETGYVDALRAERTIEAEGRLENLEELVGVGREYDASAEVSDDGEEPSVEQFLQQIALFSEQDQLRGDEGIVTLMTMHNAKGLEYDTVFMIGLEDGVFPHSRAIEAGDLEEERRLCYVGITRAERRLYVTYARTRTLYGARSYNMPSRFIDELPAELTDAEQAPPADVWGGGTAESTAPLPFHVGDDVVHATFGDGVVTGVQAGGIVTVHFATDGRDRQLMADYAPLRRR
jgi:DNA helicase II / ATP-dependent DNA helicase PcrA